MQKEAPNGCAPLCLVAMEHAFPALDEDAQPVGLSAVADRMSDFVHQFNGQVDKPSRQWLVQVARAQLLQAAAPEEGLPWEGEAFIGR